MFQTTNQISQMLPGIFSNIDPINKWPSFVGEYSSTMEHLGYEIHEWWSYMILRFDDSMCLETQHHVFGDVWAIMEEETEEVIYLPCPGSFQIHALNISPDCRLVSSVGLSNFTWQWAQSGTWNINLMLPTTNPVCANLSTCNGILTYMSYTKIT